MLNDFEGYHSEWNLVGPGGWVYQRLTLEKLWRVGELTEIIKIEDKTLEIANLQPWGGRPAIIPSDGLCSFGADLRQ